MENKTQTGQFAVRSENGVVKQIGHFYVGVPVAGRKEEYSAENNHNSDLLHNRSGVHTGGGCLTEDAV